MTYKQTRVYTIKLSDHSTTKTFISLDWVELQNIVSALIEGSFKNTLLLPSSDPLALHRLMHSAEHSVSSTTHLPVLL